MARENYPAYRRKSLRDIFYAGGHVIQALHIALRSGCSVEPNDGAAGSDRAAGTAKINGHKILAHESGELDRGDAIEFDLHVGADFHADHDHIVGEFDFFHAADLDASHFHAMPIFKS